MNDSETDDTDAFPLVDYSDQVDADSAENAADGYAEAPRAYSEGDKPNATSYAQYAPVKHDDDPLAASNANPAASGDGAAINWPTVMLAVGTAALVAAVVLSIGLVALTLDNSTARAGQDSAQRVVNFGSPAAVAAPGIVAPTQTTVPEPADTNTPEAPGVVPMTVTELAPGLPNSAGTQRNTPGTTSSPAPTDGARHTTSPRAVSKTSVQDLYVRTATPAAKDLEWQANAFWNPKLPLNPKVENSYGGEKARAAVSQAMQLGTMYDFMSITTLADGPPTVNGNRAQITFNASIAGFPIQKVKYHYIRQDGLWKLDWKLTCKELQCPGNPNFGY